MLGSGAWGTAIADLIARNTNQNVHLWSYEKQVAEKINSDLKNHKYLPNKKLSNKIIADYHLPNLNIEIIFVAIPSQFIFDFFKKTKNHFKKYQKKTYNFVICSKGIDYKRKKLLSDVIIDFFPKSKVAILSGPSFAIEVVNRKPTAITLATKSSQLASLTTTLLKNKYFRVYLTKDIIGVQINGTMKNVLAIAAGLSEGLNLGENARGAILARGIKEIIRLVKAVGGKKDTVLGLSGLGDIILTSVSRSSRNYNFGFMLGSGKKVKNLININKHVTEGADNIKVIYFLKEKYKVNMPIIDAIYKVLTKNYSFNKAIQDLLSRPLSHD